MDKGVGNERLHQAEEMHVAGDGGQPKSTETRKKNHWNRRRGEKAIKAEDLSGAQRLPGPSPTQPGLGQVNQLVEELELNKCDYLDQSGYREQVKKLVEEFHDIFMAEEK